MSTTITLTDRAASRILEILAREPGKSALRIAVNGGGCSGFQYEFVLAEQPAEDDLVIERGGARALVDPMSQGFLEGAEIDFVDDLMGQSFRIRNPNATSSCGCGTSFSI
ncbi:iron-sulfur cluster insertion protein ErpA [Aestuariivirga sp.]|jgi:iron-sulfur cluster assembly accessory protein|uniref:iron-sulfur cluster insertion protein ErpA n=1 Tax=Aestuariivirga sp. TaxID=2650926 RepID=UPI0039190754